MGCCLVQKKMKRGALLKISERGSHVSVSLTLELVRRIRCKCGTKFEHEYESVALMMVSRHIRQRHRRLFARLIRSARELALAEGIKG